MKIRLLFVLSFGLLIAGCAGLPVTDLKRTDSYADKKISEISSAPTVMKPVGTLILDHAFKITLDDKRSPIFTQDGVDSRFELLEVAGKKDQPFTINVVAMCDCLGFAKKAVAPVVYLLNSSGAVVGKETPNERPEKDTLYKMFKTLKGSFPADGTYIVAVVADYHGARDVRVGDAIGYIGLIPFKVAIYQYPRGDVLVSWVAEKKTVN